MAMAEHTVARFWKCALQVNSSGYIAYRGADHKMTEEQYNAELVQVALENDVKVVGIADHGQEDYCPLDKLSKGQQCTAILHLLLLGNKDPLLMDQPEDSLDNAFIADRIVAELRRSKIDRQFVFATHNANIPVLGDAEWIGVFGVYDGKASMSLASQVGVDLPSIREKAAEILEGGKVAFNQRKAKYGY
jgi:ABC-type nitrate/sulfonate/bicarbonate transport system ATPase subunit